MRAALTLVFLWFVAATSAAQERPNPCAAAPSNPADVSLTLSLTDARVVFHEGEIIGLTLAFSSTASNKYFLNTRNYDRSGRLDVEAFCVEPGSGRDPLDDYFRSGLSGFIGGGIGGFQPLNTKPSIVQIELNEWTALPSGTYRLRLISGRIHRSAGPGEPGSGSVQVSLGSNTVEFEIAPATAEWQASQLDAATRALDAGADEAAKRHGARMLRFLGSEAATRELARRFFALADQPFGWELMFGLIASPYRQTAIDAMKTSIADPSHAITAEFVTTLALLEVQANAEYRLPPYTDVNKDAWTRLRDRKVDAYHRAIAGHIAEVATALTAKNETARAITINALLTAPSGTTDRALLKPLLLASWDSVPLRTRNELIQYRWDTIAGPEMLPILRRIVDTPRVRGRPPDQPDPGPALARIYELSPAEGRELIVREILNPKHDIDISVLGRLPDRELPEIEQPVLSRVRIGNGGEVDYQLLERYATSKPFPDLQQLYGEHRGQWACAPQTAMLRYFLRIDRAYGVAQVADALGQRQVTGCYRMVFTDLKEAFAIPELERLAIATLEDPSAEVARNAAEALGRYGSADAEAPLWNRLQKFHEVWKDRYEELRVGPAPASARAAEGMVEYALVDALSRGDAWLCGPEKLERLRSLVSPPRQDQLTARLAAWQRGQLTLSLSWSGDGRLSYDLASYSGNTIDQLIRKLKQFPSGTQIGLSLRSDVADRHHAEIDVVQAAARSSGVALEIKKN